MLARIMRVKQDQIATHIGISRVSVSRYFNGHTQIGADDLKKLLEFLGLNLEHAINKRIDEELSRGNIPK